MQGEWQSSSTVMQEVDEMIGTPENGVPAKQS